MNHPRSTRPRAATLATLAAALAVSWTGAARGDAAVHFLVSQIDDDDFGASMAAGDFNGDGFVDLAVGAPRSPRLGDRQGTVHIWLGNAESEFGQETADERAYLGLREIDPEAPWTFEGFGRTLAAADVDGNGVTDLLASDEDGRVWVMRGFVGPEGEPGEIGDMGVTLFAEGLDGITRLEAVGDVDGDGIEDVAVVSRWAQDCPCEDGVASGLAEVGRVSVLLGDGDYIRDAPVAARALPMPDEQLACGCAVDPADSCLRRCEFGADLLGGRSLASADRAALLVGAPGVGDLPDGSQPPLGHGAIYVYDGLDPVRPRTIRGPAGGESIGRSMAWLDARSANTDAWLLTSADDAEVRVYRMYDAEIDDEPADGVGQGQLQGIERPVFETGLIDLGDEPDLLVGDMLPGRPVRGLYGPVALPPGGVDAVLDASDGGWQIRPPFLVVGQMNDGLSAREVAVVEERLDGARVVRRVKLYVDGLPEAADTDGDGVVDVLDNCRQIPNPSQIDRDGDDDGDPCDACPAEAGPGDGDGVCASDCLTVYPEAAGDASPLRALWSAGEMQWYGVETFDDPEMIEPSLDLHGGRLDPGLSAYVAADPWLGVSIEFDPYAYGQRPTHVGLSVQAVCDGPVWLWFVTGDGQVSVIEFDLGAVVAADGGRFLAVKHPAGIAAVDVTALCYGPLELGEVQVGRSEAPVPCLAPANQQGLDNCRDVANRDQLDSDGDGVGDACDCGAPNEASAENNHCVPVRAVRGFSERVSCEEAGDFDSGPAYAELRTVFDLRGHEVESGVERFDAEGAVEMARRTDIFVLLGDEAVGDDELCALERFVEAGGAVLDVRDVEWTLFGGRRVDALANGQFECVGSETSVALCDGVRDDIGHGPGSGLAFAATDVAVQPVLIDGRGQIAAAVIEADGGRAAIFGDDGLARGKGVCDGGFLHQPSLHRLLRNTIDFLADAEGYDDDADDDLADCFGPPGLEDVADQVVPIDGAGEWVILDVDDEATPVDQLNWTLSADPPELVDTVASMVVFDRDAEHWKLRLHGGLAALSGEVTLVVRDRDGEADEVSFDVDVICVDDDCAPAPCAAYDGGVCPCMGPDCGACEVDSDGDGWCDENDHCPFVYDPDQADSDHDGVGDVCDLVDGPEHPDTEHQGMQLQGGCAVTPGRAPTGPLFIGIGLLALIGATRRR